MKVKKIGLIIIAIGLMCPILFFALNGTIRRSLVDLPLPLHSGVVRQDFSVDYTGHYIMGIEMDKSLSSQNIKCLFGADDIASEASLECNHTPPVLSFQWKLVRDGQIVATSTSARFGSGPSSGRMVMASFGIFQAERGHRYEVLLDFARDASKIAVGQPRLRIILDPWSYEEILVGEVIAIGLCFVCLLTGGIILGMSWWISWRGRTALPT